MTIYCTCGNPTQYSGTRPKFCSSCATPFDKTAANLAQAAKAREPIVYADESEARPAPRPQRPGARPTARPVRQPVYEDEFFEEIPTLTISAEVDAPEKLTVASLRSQANFSSDRPTLGKEALAAKNEALKHMLTPPPPQVNGDPEA